MSKEDKRRLEPRFWQALPHPKKYLSIENRSQSSSALLICQKTRFIRAIERKSMMGKKNKSSHSFTMTSGK